MNDRAFHFQGAFHPQHTSKPNNPAFTRTSLAPGRNAAFGNWPAALSRLSPEKAGFCVSVTCIGNGGTQETSHGLSNMLDESYASSAKVKFRNE